MSNSWQCPECETTNTGPKCVVCGCPRPQNVKEYDEQRNTQNQNYANFQPPFNKLDTDQTQQITDDSKKLRILPFVLIIGFVIAFTVITLVIAAFRKSNENYTGIIPEIETTTRITTSIVESNNSSEKIEETTIPISEETLFETTITPVTKQKNNDAVLPSLISMNYSDAIKILDSLGLKYTITFSDKKYVEVGENCVYSQKPASGTYVSLDTVIKIGVSTYKEKSEPVTTSVPHSTETNIKTVVTTTPTRSTKLETTTLNTTTTKEVKYYTVKFYVKGKAIPVTVEEGKDAKPPIIEYDLDIEEFIEWNGDYKNVTENRDVYALFEPVHKTETESTTTASKQRVGYDGNVVLLLTFSNYSLNNLNVPIEGTSWSDYYWSSSNEYSVQVISGSLQTYFEGEAVLTLTYIYDTSIVATTKVRIVSQIPQ